MEKIQIIINKQFDGFTLGTSPLPALNGFVAQYAVRFSQLKLPITPSLYYVFLARFQDRWQDFIVIKRQELLDYFQILNIGSKSEDKIVFRLNYKVNDSGGYSISSGKIDLTKHRNNFSPWPEILH